MKIYEITSEFRNLEELYEMAIDIETGEIIDAEALEELEIGVKNQLSKKSEGVIKYLQNSAILLDGIDGEIKRLQALKKSGKKKIENFKEYIVRNMETSGVKKIETSLGNLSLRASKSVEVNEIFLDKTDKRYMIEEVKYKISKSAIKKILETGEEIQGANIISRNSLQVK